jgi:hypothetical protein
MKLYRERKAALAITLVTLLVLTFSAALAQQDKSKRPSPPGTAEMTLNGKKITIEYSRPYLKGRHLGGPEIVPYDKVWRAGANEATTIVTEADLSFGNFNLPKGTYTLFTLPSATGWKLIINKKTGEWGIPYTDELVKMELVRLDMKVEKISVPVEQFTISLDKAGSGGVLKLEWETTRASIAFAEKK